jgi:beta-lactamase regulating signal transducer with metallopeptidase domain
MNPTADFVLALAVVSSAALGGAWLAAGSTRPLALREALWKSALLLSLVLPAVNVAAHLPRNVETRSISVLVRDPRVLDELGVRRLEPRGDTPGVQRISPPWRARTTVPTLLLIVGVLNALRVLIRWRRELAVIGPRRPVLEGPALRALLGGLGVGPVRVTAAAGLAVPGVVASKEICLPEEHAARVESADVIAVVAHEAAHVKRGDLRWLRLAGICEALFFFQPLFRVARRELLRVAEFQADEASVRSTGQPEALVNALLEYARKVQGGAPDGVLPLGTRESQFVQRVHRILSLDPRARTYPVLGWAPLTVVMLALAASAAVFAAKAPPLRVRTEVVKRDRIALAPAELRRERRVEPGGAGAPLLEASEDTPDGVVDATITRARDGALITEFRLDGHPTPATRELSEWLHRVLSREEHAAGPGAGDS